MTEVYKAETRLKAWLQATESLLNEDRLNVGKYDRLNIVLEINSPATQDPLSPKVMPKFDDMCREVGMEPTHTVAEWIFPGWLYRREGIQGVYETYPDQLEAILTNHGRWGTYANRMVKRKDPNNGSIFNPLKTLISKMRQSYESEGGTFHSCYELDLHQGTFDIPLYDSTIDRRKRRNLPCLSHLSFKLFDEKVHLTSFYRAHDYRFKVPGNLLGLARLQDCVADEVGAGVGPLVVHSTRAYVNQKRGIPEFQTLINDSVTELNTD